MKVVLFCGGQGMRLRDYSDQVPKPMVPLGDRPILWHLMKYYAHYGHREFILCLGYRGVAIKKFFLEYAEEESNDFRLRNGGRELFASDINDWDVTFVDTGLHTEQGERLRRIRDHLEGDEVFLANYADGLADLHLPTYIDRFLESDAAASMIAVRPWLPYHQVTFDEDSKLRAFEQVSDSDVWLNGGFFAFREEVFDFIEPGDDLATPLTRLAQVGKVMVQKHDGFFAPMDTFKDKMQLDERYEGGNAPWVIWKNNDW